MRRLTIILTALFFVSLIHNLFQCGRYKDIERNEFVDTTTVVVEIYDTIPVPRDSVVLRYETRKLPVAATPEVQVVHDTTIIAVLDSAEVIIPITQTKYETEEYRAYVSGYEARLDSCITFNRSQIINIRSPTQSRRISIGLQGGYGITPSGFQPYIGFGITYKIW